MRRPGSVRLDRGIGLINQLVQPTMNAASEGLLIPIESEGAFLI